MKSIYSLMTGIFTMIFIILSGTSAFADSLKDVELTRRINFIQYHLDEGTINARRWQYSWMFINGSIGYLQLGMAITQTDSDEKDDRYDNIVGGISGLLATGDLILNPLTSWNAASKLRNLPQSSTVEKQAKLAYAEKLLKIPQIVKFTDDPGKHMQWQHL
jgi:hypothetical protein